MSLRTARPCQCIGRRMIQAVVHGDRDLVADVGPDHRARNGVVVRKRGAPGAAEIDVGGTGVRRAVTVFPVWGRAASAAAIGSVVPLPLGAVAVVERLQATRRRTAQHAGGEESAPAQSGGKGPARHHNPVVGVVSLHCVPPVRGFGVGCVKIFKTPTPGTGTAR